MELASGWKREDAVVSEATRRLQFWAGSGLWHVPDVDEGALPLARAMRALLGARGALVLAHAPGGWRPLAWARDEETVLFDVPEKDAGEASGGAVLRADAAFSDAMPLLREDWSDEQSAFAARAVAFASEHEQFDLAPDATLAQEDEQNSALLDTENRAAEQAARRAGDEAADEWAFWHAPPSLLLPLLSPAPETSTSGVAAAVEDPVAVGPPQGVVLAWIESDDGRVSDEWATLWRACAEQAAAWMATAARAEQVAASYSDLVQLFARVVDSRDPRRDGHGALVAHACVLTARALGLSEREVAEWEIAGLLHGVGRVPVPDAILQKQISLSPEERDAVRFSLLTGANWLADVEGWAGAADIVRHAGERWDGKGYPDGLEGEAIPLGSRALAVALRFAAMSQARPDRGALGSLRNVATALEAESGRALDPRVLSLFLSALRRSSK
jgi:hypothetical protein